LSQDPARRTGGGAVAEDEHGVRCVLDVTRLFAETDEPRRIALAKVLALSVEATTGYA
jgi:hypothetical protein